jgi:hypothetical protein
MISSKKGQGMPLSVIITGVIVVVVAIVLILTTTEFGKKLIGLGGATPSALEAATQGCIVAAQNNLITDYCYNYRKVGNTEWVNCQDPRVQSSLTQQGISSGISCDSTLEGNEIASICSDLTTSQQGDARFNGVARCTNAPAQ